MVALTSVIESHSGWLCGADGCGADPGGPGAPPPEKTHWLDPIQLIAQTSVLVSSNVVFPADEVVPYAVSVTRANSIAVGGPGRQPANE